MTFELILAAIRHVVGLTRTVASMIKGKTLEEIIIAYQKTTPRRGPGPRGVPVRGAQGVEVSIVVVLSRARSCLVVRCLRFARQRRDDACAWPAPRDDGAEPLRADNPHASNRDHSKRSRGRAREARAAKWREQNQRTQGQRQWQRAIGPSSTKFEW